MSEHCPETCSKRFVLQRLQETSGASTVIEEVTGYDMSYSQGVAQYTHGKTGEDYELEAASVYNRADRYLSPDELARVNDELVKRNQARLDLKEELGQCTGLVEVALEDDSKALVCGAELVRITTHTTA